MSYVKCRVQLDGHGQAGLGLIEVVLAVAVLSVVILGVMSAMVNMQNVVGAAKFRSDADQFAAEVRTHLSSMGACTNSFAGLVVDAVTNPSVTNLKEGGPAPGQVVYALNAVYGDQTLILQSLKLINYEAGATANSARMTLSMGLGSNKQIAGPQIIPRNIKLSLAMDAVNKRILSCVALSAAGGGDSIWSRTTSNSDNIYFAPASAPAGGAVGIGTASPEEILEVWGAGGVAPVLRMVNPTANSDTHTLVRMEHYMGGASLGYPAIELSNSRGSIGAATQAAVRRNDTLGAIEFFGNDSTGAIWTPSGKHTQGAIIWATATENFSTAGHGGRLEFGTTPNGSTDFAVRRMVIENNGNVGVGTASPVYLLDVAGDVNSSGCFKSKGSTVAGTCSSDALLKTDIRPFEPGLKALLGIKPRTFKFNGLGGQPASQEPELGVVAQEVEKTAPFLVEKAAVKLRESDPAPTEIKKVNYSAFTYMLINAVKELYHQWSHDSAALRQQLLEKELRLEELEKRLRRLEEKLGQSH